MKTEITYLLGEGYKKLETDEHHNTLLINEDLRVSVILSPKFGFSAKETADAIKLKEKYQKEHRFIEKKTICFISEFIWNKEDETYEHLEKRVLNDEYFFMKNNIKDLKEIIPAFKKDIKITIKISDNMSDKGNYISNVYLSSVSDNREILKYLTNTKKKEVTLTYPIGLTDRAYYLKYMLSSIWPIDFKPLEF